MVHLEKGTFSKLIKAVWIAFIAFWALLIFYVFAVNVNLFWLFGAMPELKSLENPKNELASEVYSSDNVLIGKYFIENRSPVEYEQISPNLIHALLATEDVRFERHSGIDFKATVSIPWYVLKGDPKGSSTISQQLAKNQFRTRTDESRGLLGGVPLIGMAIIKTKEWITAIQIERNYTKREIMTMYLNTVDFGSNAFGIKTAAKTFFKKDPAELTPDEAAMLVGVLKSTTRYNPVRNPNLALERRNTVLAQMHKYGYISGADFERLKEIPIHKMMANYEVENHNKGLATYFRSYIKDNFLMKWAKERDLNIYRDGLKIYTTIDSRMQRYAEEVIEDHMKDVQKNFFAHWKGQNPWRDENGKEIPNFIENTVRKSDKFRYILKEQFDNDEEAFWKYMNTPAKMRVFTWNGDKDTTLTPVDSIKYYKHFLHTGFMSMDPNTGHVKAWVGGIDFKHFQYDHVKQGRRQPGSSFKPIVYATGMDNGYSPCYEVVDAPVTFARDEKGEPWTPQNSTGAPSGQRMTLRQAMGQSVNTISAFLVKSLGPTKVVEYAKRLGITSPLEAVPSIALGTQDVSVYDLLGVYSTFVNSGVWVEPQFITRIEDRNGNVIWEQPVRTYEALSEETAYLMVHMLKGALQEKGGTARGLFRYKCSWNAEIGAKTGTTQNYSDGWFMGVTPNLVTGLWVGGDDRSIHFRNRSGEGGRIALPAWGMYMDKLYSDPNFTDLKKGTFKKPKNLSVSLDCQLYQTAVPVSDSTYTVPKTDSLGEGLL